MKFFGIPSGYDLQQHFQFASTFYDAIYSGDLFPSWSAKDNYGFGEIGIRFYPPLAYYVLAFARIICGNWFDASWVTFSFWMVLGSIGIYVWTREWFSSSESMFAAGLYALMPYHLSQIYNSFLYGEFAAASILPFCFAFITKVCYRDRFKDVIYLSITLALLILTHIPSTIISVPCLIIYTITIFDKRILTNTLFKTLFSIVICLAVTAFYWLRILMEMTWVRHYSPEFSNGYYNYQNHFLPYFVHTTQNQYLAKGYWYADTIALLTVLLLLLMFISALVSNNLLNGEIVRIKVTRSILLIGSVCILMSTPVSYFLWGNITFIQKIQFPWRWLTVLSLIVAVASAITINNIKTLKSKLSRTFSYLLVILLLFIVIFNITQTIASVASAPIQRKEFEEMLPTMFENEGCECWWPIWSTREAFINKTKVSASARQVEIQNWSAEQREFKIETGEANQARIATFYYPYWQAKVNGELVQVQKAEDGTILIPLPPEKASIVLFFRRTISSASCNSNIIYYLDIYFYRNPWPTLFHPR